jgi:RND superfamily putative drug exporter
VVAAVAVIATSPGLPTTTNESSFLPKSYQSIRAANLQDKAFPQAGLVTASAAIIVFSRADGGKLTPADSAKVRSVASSLGARHIHNIVGVTAGPPSPNHEVQTALVAMPSNVVNGSSTAAGDAIKVLRADIKPLVAGTGLHEGVTGSAAQQLDSQQSSQRAEQIVLLATLVLILLLLLVIFRSPIIAVLPLVVIALVSQVATGLISDVNKALNLNTDSSISTILIVVLFGIGTDYILFLMFRYRERLRAGEDPKQAMVSAVTRVGEVIASAA